MNLFHSFFVLFRFLRTLSSTPAISSLAVAFLATLMVFPAQAGLVQFDFNDNTAGVLAGQLGGSGATTAWIAGGTHIVESGDLTAPVGTNFGLTQSVGFAQSVSNDGGVSTTNAQLARAFDTPLTGSVWFSFLADVPESTTRNGIGWASTSGAVLSPRLLFLSDGIRFINGVGDSGTVGSGFVGQTNLVVGRIDLDTSGSDDEISFWVNPNVNAPLGTPLYTSAVGDAFGSSIGSINIQSYNPNSGGIDFISLSDTGTAYFDVTGASPFSAAEWVATGSGSWGVGANWDINQVPDGQDTTFGTAITGPATVTLDTDRAVNELVFNNSNSYTVSANTLTVGANVTTSQGSHTISSAVDFAPGTRTLTSASGTSLNITGTTTFTSDGSGTLILDGDGGGSVGVILDNADTGNPLNGTDNVSVVKRGLGTWTIGPGTSTLEDFHGGNTTIEAGTLAVKADSPGGTVGELRSPEIEVQTGATFDTSQFSTYSLGIGQALRGGGEVDAGGTGTLQVFSDNLVSPGDSGAGTLNVTGSLTLNAFEGASPTGSLQFELSSSTAGSNDQIAVSGNLISNAGGGGNVTRISVIPTDTSLQSGGSYEVITFGGTHTGSASDFAIDTSLQTRFAQSISADSDSINVDISGTNASLVWRGNDGSNPTYWDVNTTSNWDNSGADVFYDLDAVTFDDTGIGTTVALQSSVTPAAVTFNNSTKDYSIDSDPNDNGAIAGGGGVTKSGTGRVTINTSNTYTGTTTISAGVLHAANNTALGSTAGRTKVTGGTLDITGTNIGREVVEIQGAGSDGRGALITDGFDSLGGGARQINYVEQTGDATIGAYSDQPANSIFAANDYRWDLEPATSFPSTDASWNGNGFDLTKKGRGTVSIQRVGDMGVQNINIEQGTLLWQGDTTSSGATVTVGDNINRYKDPTTEETGSAALSMYNFSGTGPGPVGGHGINVVLQGGGLSLTAESGFDSSINGFVVNNDVTSDSTIDNEILSQNGNTLTFPNGITGDGDLRFTGFASGIVELQGNNTYTGVTEVADVTVALTGTGQLSGTPEIVIEGTIDATGRGDSTLTPSGQTIDLAGATAVVGNLTTSAGSTVKVFGDGSATVGPATVVLTPAQDRRIRYNPNTVQDANATQGQGLFVGTISTSAGANGNNDLNRSVLEFDLSVEPSLVGVTDIDSVQLRMNKSSVDSSSVGGNVTLELHELLDDFVTTEVTAAVASAGVPWTGYTLDGDVDACVGAECAVGALISTAIGDATDALGVDVVFTDNQGGAFETLVENALTGSGSVKFRMNADATAEAAAVRNLFRFGSYLQGSASELEITYTGTVVDIGTSAIDGDFTLDASSTLELDIYEAGSSDLLDVSGSAVLDGILDANLLTGSPLAVNDQITVLTTAGGITDGGLSISGPFTHSIIGNDLVLTFTGGAFDPADLNMDGFVDGLDLGILLGNWNQNGVPPSGGELNGVDPVDGLDLGILLGAWNPPPLAATTAVPEPSSFVLLGLGVLSLLRRKRS